MEIKKLEVERQREKDAVVQDITVIYPKRRMILILDQINGGKESGVGDEREYLRRREERTECTSIEDLVDYRRKFKHFRTR